jgi:uracil phosphoribosyltransferase
LQFLKSGLGGQDINFPTNYKESLDANKYIVPGLGDFGDRLYGTHA